MRTVRFAVVACALAFLALAGPVFAAEPRIATPVLVAAPAVSGTPAAGQTLACSTGSWSGAAQISYAYQWLRGGAAIAGANAGTYTVAAADEGSSISCQVIASSAGGEYSIGGLAGGSYRLSFDPVAADYLLQFYDGVASSAEASAVTLAAGGETSAVDAALAAGATISGQLTAAVGGATIAGAQVCAEPTEAADENVQCAETSASGEYSIDALAPGSYAVDFRASGTPYLSEYYEHAAAKAEAAKVSVPAGGVVSGIDGQLAVGGRITGIVTTAGPAPLPGIRVCASPKPGGSPSQCADSDAAGQYSIDGLAAGEYAVEFDGRSAGDYAPQWYDAAATEAGASAVKVAPATETGAIDALMSKGAQIEGTVTAEGSATPLAGIRVCASRTQQHECQTTGAGGEYAIGGLAEGTYAVSFSDPEGPVAGYPGRYLSPEATTEVKLEAAQVKEGVDAALAEGAQIDGTVTASGQPAEGVEVCVVATPKAASGPCTISAAGGTYAILGIPSGSYKVQFNTDARALEGLEGERLLTRFYTASGNPEEEAAVILVKAPSQTENIDAVMQAGGQISGRVTAAQQGSSTTSAPLSGVRVCATETTTAGEGCAYTSAAGSSAPAISDAVTIPVPVVPVIITVPPAQPSSAFTIARSASFNVKTGYLTISVLVTNPGTVHWNLVFKNADVGFADSLGIGGIGAQAASRSPKRCRAGLVRHGSRCVHLTVPFALGTQSVASGTAAVKLHLEAKALSALRAGHELHVSGSVSFQSALGGAPVTHTVAVVLHSPVKPKAKTHHN